MWLYHRPWMPSPAPIIQPENPVRTSSDEVRTIFISGLPDDVKEREIQNLLRWLPGYEASEVNFKGEQLMGFALFSSVQLAMAAKDALQNMKDNPPCNTLFIGNLGENIIEGPI